LVFKEALLVYQFLEVSLEKAQDILKAVSSKEKNSGFKKIALVLHPDKNKHPQAKEAFQKALQIFNK
jgi:curved DNA-binding protein CbpA